MRCLCGSENVIFQYKRIFKVEVLLITSENTLDLLGHNTLMYCESELLTKLKSLFFLA